MNEYEKALAIAYEEYIAKVKAIATKAEREILIPWLELNRYDFATGMGTFVVIDPNKKSEDPRNYDWYRMFNLPKHVEDVLNLEVEGSWGNSQLGLWMIDYKSKRS